MSTEEGISHIHSNLQIYYYNEEDRKQDRERFKGQTSKKYQWMIKHPEEAREKLYIMCRDCHRLMKMGKLPMIKRKETAKK